MKDVTALLQNDIRTVFDIMVGMVRECKDINDAYFKTDAQSEVTGLAADTDPATIETKLTKIEYVNGITFTGELNDFFQNAAVTQSDYLATLDKLIYGSAGTLSAILSNATENIGTRLYNHAVNCIDVYKKALDIIDTYYDNEVSDAVTNLDAQRVIYGSDMTKDDLTNAITLLEQYRNMITNAAVTTADYVSTIAKWERLEKIVL